MSMSVVTNNIRRMSKMMTLAAQYPKMVLKEEEAVLWAGVRERFKYMRITEAQWNKLHKKLIKTYYDEGKLIVI